MGHPLVLATASRASKNGDHDEHDELEHGNYRERSGKEQQCPDEEAGERLVGRAPTTLGNVHSVGGQSDPEPNRKSDHEAGSQDRFGDAMDCTDT